MEIAVIIAHMDDEIISISGTIARCNAEGHNIHVLVLTDSCSAGHKDVVLKEGTQGTVYQEVSISEKQHEFLAASEIVRGYKSWKICEFPDMRLDTIPHVDLNRAIESFIDDVQPETVFTHHPGDINKDHRLVYESVMVATRPVPGSSVKKVLCCESMYNNEWNGQSFVPNTYVDISKTLSDKIAALEEYKSELQEFPHPRSVDSVKYLAYSRGSAAGVRAAEAFQLVRSIE